MKRMASATEPIIDVPRHSVSRLARHDVGCLWLNLRPERFTVNWRLGSNSKCNTTLVGYGVTRLSGSSECTTLTLVSVQPRHVLKSYSCPGIEFDSPHESLSIHLSALRRCASRVNS